MKVSVYQIIPELDEQGLLFRDMRFVTKAGGGQIPSELYECVYTGELEVSNPEQVFMICNTAHPEGYRGHSMSVSDVVEFYHSSEQSEFFYCDSPGGFPKINFDKEKTMLNILNHNFDDVLEIRNMVKVYFITEDGLKGIFCEKMMVQRCKYSQSHLGYRILCWGYGDNTSTEYQFLERPKLVITESIAEFPHFLLNGSEKEECGRMRYPVYSNENLKVVCNWLKENHCEYEEL